MIKLNKVVLENVSNVAVMHVEKVDNRVNNTGRPVNKKSISKVKQSSIKQLTKCRCVSS